MRKAASALVLYCALAGTTTVCGQDKKDDQPEQLPSPRRADPQEVLPQPQQINPNAQPGVVPQMMLMIPREEPPRLGRQSIWQLYSVDSRGQFQRRVVYSPTGAYYMQNGAPYPWASTRPSNFSSFISD